MAIATPCEMRLIEALAAILRTPARAADIALKALQKEGSTFDPAAPQPLPPRIYVHLEGGLVQDIVSPTPGFFGDVQFFVVDYDTEGGDDDEQGFVKQADGDWARAYVSFHGAPSQATIEPLFDENGEAVKGEDHPLAPQAEEA